MDLRRSWLLYTGDSQSSMSLDIFLSFPLLIRIARLVDPGRLGVRISVNNAEEGRHDDIG